MSSTLSEPRVAFYWYAYRCSEKCVRYTQIGSMVIEEGGEARTIILCKQCYNANFVQQGKQPLKSWEWKEVVEKKVHWSRPWEVFGNEQFLRGMWENCILKRAGAREIPADVAQEKQ